MRRRLGKLEIVFLALLAIYALLYFAVPKSGVRGLVTFATYATGVVVAIRYARLGMRKAIWRLRNRLIIAYLFIAVVPIVLIMVMVASSAYFLTGQIAVYLVDSELDRRTGWLMGPAEALLRTTPDNRADVVRRMAPIMRGRFGRLMVIARSGATETHYPDDVSLPAPPSDWGNTTGLVLRDGHLYSWAHVANGTNDITVLAPIDHDYLSELVPGIGDVVVLDLSDTSGTPNAGYRSRTLKLGDMKGRRRDRVPPKANAADVEVTGFAPIPVYFWDQPGKPQTCAMFVETRASAVLRTVFGEKVDWGQTVILIGISVATLWLIGELVSLIIGVSITRTITGAVHDLYEGTQRIKEGDFSHRIPVHGKDQLGELSHSFNTMTENLQRLIVVEKEKERLQSELAIAREVQNQLFPKNAPALQTLQLTGVCNPARMVSGDYYDFLSVMDRSVAFAIGDVAGKGISAALLMAAIQSIMRAQLTAGVPAAVAAGNGRSEEHISTAHLVSHLNRQLYANTSPEKYATFFVGLYDESDSTLTYTNAGHLPPILVRDGTADLLEVTGTIVGALPFARYEEKQLRLKTGDLLVGYTDGITEPENEYGEMFGEERLKDLVVKYAGAEPNELVARCMEAVIQWSGASAELPDDMTMLVVRRL